MGEGNLGGVLDVSGEGSAVEGGWEGAGQESEAIGPGEETGRWGERCAAMSSLARGGDWEVEALGNADPMEEAHGADLREEETRCA